MPPTPTDARGSIDAEQPLWRSPLVLLAVTCVAFIYLFMKFASEVVERETGTFDSSVRNWIVDHSPSIVVGFFGLITYLGDWRVLFVAAVAVGLVLVRRGARKRPLVVATVPFFLSIIVRQLKQWYQINRPPTEFASALTFAFPSGHSSASTAVAVVIGYVLMRERVAPRLGLTIAIVIPILVGVSRLYLDVHWASDVIGGWIIGGAYAAAVCAMYERARGRADYSSRQAA